MKQWKKILFGLSAGIVVASALVLGLTQLGGQTFGYVNKFNPFTRQLDRVATTSDFTGDFLYKPGISGGQTAYGGADTTDNLTFYSNQSKDGYINIGDNARLYEPYGQLQLGIDPLIGSFDDDPNVPLFALADSDDYYVTNIYNISTGTSAETGYVAANSDPTSYNYLAMLGVSNTLYATYNPGAALLEANAANLYINALGMTQDTGNVYISSGGNQSKNNIKMGILYDGHVIIGGYTNTIASAKLEVQGDAYFKNAVGIGTAPDPINYNFSVASPISTGINLEAGTGYNLLKMGRKLGFVATTSLGYYGLGSLFNNDIGFGGYDVGADSPGFVWTTKSVDRMHVSSTGNFYFGYNQSDDLFEIGTLDNANLTARLEVQDARDASTQRTAVKINTTAVAWGASSRFVTAQNAGVEKYFVDANGITAQGVTTTVQSNGNAAVLLFTQTLASFRAYNFKIRLEGLRVTGATDNAYLTMSQFFSKRSAAPPIVEGTTDYTCQPVATCGYISMPYFVINGDAVEVWAKGSVGANWQWTAWKNFEVQG